MTFENRRAPVPIAASVALVATAMAASLVTTASRGDEKCGNTDASDATVEITYRITDQALLQSLKQAGAPAGVRGHESRHVVRRGPYVRERVTGKLWVLDVEALRKETERLQRAVESQNIDVTKVQAMTPGYRVAIEDRVRARGPEWFFSYDDTTKTGLKQLNPGDFDALKHAQRQSSRDLTERVLSDVAEVLEGSVSVEVAGRETIAGVDCEMSVAGPPLPGKFCVATIAGRPTILYSEIEQSKGRVRVEEAVEVRTGECVEMDRFQPPIDVDFG